MVKPREQRIVFEAGQFDLGQWLKDLGAERADLDLERINRACDLSAQAEERRSNWDRAGHRVVAVTIWAWKLPIFCEISGLTRMA